MTRGRAGVEADLIVVHGISLPPGEYGGPWIDRLFTNTLPADVHPYFAEIAGLRVSAHLAVTRDGAVTQYVSFTERAWHAGKSNFQGREACNDFSVGVELEGTDTQPYEAVQYERLAQVVAALCAAYPRLSADRLVGHSDIAPGRKTDPGTGVRLGARPPPDRRRSVRVRQTPNALRAEPRSSSRRELHHVLRQYIFAPIPADFPDIADT